MGQLRSYFNKAGGWSLIRQYAKTGVLPIAIIQFLLLGRSKKALELLRLVVQFKIQNKLIRHYYRVLRKFDSFDFSSLPHVHSNKIWIFWWQGIDNAPDLVKVCFASVTRYLSNDWDIILLTKDNYKEYVSFPDFILKKFDKGVITLTHFSDLLRLELLIQYGGMWLDATVFCSGNKLPVNALKTDLFVFQTQKPGADGHATLMSSWLILAKSNHPILLGTRELLYEYWSKKDWMVDYFLIHHFFTMSCKCFQEEKAKIPPVDNSIPHLLQLHLFDPYDEDRWNHWKSLTCFHKLSYKFIEEDFDKEGTFYKEVIFNKI